MAKPFYSLEEVVAKLGKSEDDVKQLVRDGTLREFRDAGKIFFKSEDVDRIAGGGDEVTLEPVDEPLPSLGDMKGGTSVLGLEPMEETPAPTAKPPAAEDDTVISSSGIGVFDDDELEIDADPMAKTQITEATSDRVSLEGSAGGSGLLDLTRESDDTSLGELLDEIYPGEEDAAPAQPSRSGRRGRGSRRSRGNRSPGGASRRGSAVPASSGGEVLMPAYAAVAADPSEGLFSGLLFGATLLLALGASVAAAVSQNFMPDYANWLTQNFWIFLGIGVGVPVVCLLVGWVVGKAGQR